MTHSVPIRFVRPWQGRAVGQIERLLAPGVAMTLVEYGFAERVFDTQKPSTSKRKRKPVLSSNEGGNE